MNGFERLSLLNVEKQFEAKKFMIKKETIQDTNWVVVELLFYRKETLCVLT